MTSPDLDDQRSFLLRSLEDLDREHDVGDLSDEDHARLRDGYIARVAALLRTSEGDAPAEAEPVAAAWRPDRRLVTIAVVVVVAAGLFWTLASFIGIRLPGQTVSGSVTLSASEQMARTLAQAQTLEAQGNAADAFKLYESVLRQHPNQEEASAEAGWLEYQAGAGAGQATLLARGESQERKAEMVDPGAFAPHLYLGSMLLAEGQATNAVAEFRRFLAGHPPRATVAAAVPFLTKAFSDAHQPLPVLPLGSAARG